MLYDDYRRPVLIRESGGQNLAKYRYDVLNRRTLVELENGTRTELSYDDQGWLSNLNHRFTSSTEDWVGSFTRNQLGDIQELSVMRTAATGGCPRWARARTRRTR